MRNIQLLVELGNRLSVCWRTKGKQDGRSQVTYIMQTMAVAM